MPWDHDLNNPETIDRGVQPLLHRYRIALERRRTWEALWQDCYDFALPQAKGFQGPTTPGSRRTDHLYDGTAPDAVEQLAASLLAHLTPPWSRWVGFTPGPDLTDTDREAAGPVLERMAETLQAHLDRSSFAVEFHQALLDLVTVGTACLLVEETPPGEASSLRFAAVPLADLALEEGPEGRLDTTFRRIDMTLAQLEERFAAAIIPANVHRQATKTPDTLFPVIETVVRDGPAYDYKVLLDGAGTGPIPLRQGRFGQSPFINFRWLKTPGEIYGRSPVMRSLPDIKTANKVVELVLKNASVAVSGIWQADDDGVLNPATIRLVPGAIIPKAVGSSGLKALDNPGRFDVSQLVLEDLRHRIRHALLVDRLGQVDTPRMTATEVLERAAEMARLLGATYGRLQTELLTPLVLRCLSILRRRGEIPDVSVDGRMVALQYRSPLALAQAQHDVRTTLRWLETVTALGQDALAAVDLQATALWLAEIFSVPTQLLRQQPAAEDGGSVPTPATVRPPRP